MQHPTEMKKSGIVVGLFALFVHLAAFVGFADQVYLAYSRWVFPVVRGVYDMTLGQLPFPSVYILFFVLVFSFVNFVYQYVKQQPKTKSQRTILDRFLMVLNAVGWVYFLFYFLWGFNYYRPSLESRWGMSKTQIDSTILEKELMIVTGKINALRQRLSLDTVALDYQPEWVDLEDTLRQVQTTLLHEWGDDIHGRVRIRKLNPGGLLLRISTAGVYIPFCCEGHVDPGLNAVQWPFTLAHEMAHGYGYTDEGECNFIGFLTCIHSEDYYISYSGWLAYWRYLYFQVRESSPTVAANIYSQLNGGIQADLRAIRKDLDKYPDVMPWLRDFIYDYYLRSHGVDDGLKSYNGIIALVLKWKQRNMDAYDEVIK
jgi:Protein of unknown function (DUF3810)